MFSLKLLKEHKDKIEKSLSLFTRPLCCNVFASRVIGRYCNVAVSLRRCLNQTPFIAILNRNAILISCIIYNTYGQKAGERRGIFFCSDTISHLQAYTNWVHISEEPNMCHRKRGWPSLRLLIYTQTCMRTRVFLKRHFAQG